jgi:hypothetical protein
VPVQMDNQSVRQMLVDQVAVVAGKSAEQLQAEIDGSGGDLEIDSKLGQTAAIRVALLLDMEDLIRPEDQKRRNLTSIGSLEQLIERRVRESRRDA